MINEADTFTPSSQKDWRQWLEQNHQSKQSVWLVCYKKQANIPTVSWSESVDEALCFGWIDSTRKSIAENTFMQFFCKRKPKSAWSKINKMNVERLIAAGKMAKAGYESIETAKQNGSWNLLDDVEELIIPADLEKELQQNPDAKEYFLSLSKSVRKMMLQWIAFAKRDETRRKRITEIVESSAQKTKPKPFR